MNEITREDVQRWVREELRIILDKGLMYSAEAKPQAKPQEKPQPAKQDEIPSVQALLANFPDDLQEHLSAEEVGGNWFLKMTHFIHGEKGKEIWSRINAVVKNLGGKWESMGKDSQWSVPK